MPENINAAGVACRVDKKEMKQTLASEVATDEAKHIDQVIATKLELSICLFVKE